MSHWSADDQDEPPINIVSLEICNAFFDWDIEYEYEYADFEATNNDHAIVLQAVQESNIGPDDDLADTLFNTDGSEYDHFVDGHHYLLESHLVHYSCAHASLGSILDQFETERNDGSN
eukprot:931376_1